MISIRQCFLNEGNKIFNHKPCKDIIVNDNIYSILNNNLKFYFIKKQLDADELSSYIKSYKVKDTYCFKFKLINTQLLTPNMIYSTGIKILDIFTRKNKPELIRVDGIYVQDNIFFDINQTFNILKNIFYYDYEVILIKKNCFYLIRKDISDRYTGQIFKRMRDPDCNESYNEAYNYWFYPNKRKRYMKGIDRNNYIKLQRKRITTKQFFLFD